MTFSTKYFVLISQSRQPFGENKEQVNIDTLMKELFGPASMVLFLGELARPASIFNLHYHLSELTRSRFSVGWRMRLPWVRRMQAFQSYSCQRLFRRSLPLFVMTKRGLFVRCIGAGFEFVEVERAEEVTGLPRSLRATRERYFGFKNSSRLAF